MYQAVIFDLDGTVLNTIDDLADSANAVLSAAGYPTHPTERYKTFVGSGIPKLIERMLPADAGEEAVSQILAAFGAYYDRHKEDKTAPYPGIASLLDALREHGLHLAVLSNKRHDLSVQIVTHYFGDVFDIIQGQTDEFPVKPDPSSCLSVLSRLGVDRADALYVGDSDVDMFTGANAGLTSCGVTWGFRSREELTGAGAMYIADSPDDILRIAIGGTGGNA